MAKLVADVDSAGKSLVTHLKAHVQTLRVVLGSCSAAHLFALVFPARLLGVTNFSARVGLLIAVVIYLPASFLANILATRTALFNEGATLLAATVVAGLKTSMKPTGQYFGASLVTDW